MGRLNVGDIPGYAEAVAMEQQNREVAYLDVSFDVCGIKLRQMTPRMLARLYAHGSPFLCGQAPRLSDVLQFLWGCSEDYCASPFRRSLFFHRVGRLITSGRMVIQDSVDEIYAYCDATFQDAPRGGEATTPYASQIAWIEFDMSGEPWRWPREQIMDTPLRIIYPQMRCKEMSQGRTPINPSDRIKQAFVEERARTINGNS